MKFSSLKASHTKHSCHDKKFKGKNYVTREKKNPFCFCVLFRFFKITSGPDYNDVIGPKCSIEFRTTRLAYKMAASKEQYETKKSYIFL